MFAKNKLASAVAAAIGVSAVGVAQADTVFFPYVALSETVTTVVSVINTTENNWNSDGSARAATHLHYRFYYKTGANANNLTANCEEYNEYLPTSRNDIQTIDLGGIFGANTSGVLFNDPSVNNQWQQSGRDYAFGRYLIPARGYLTVDNSNADPSFIANRGELANIPTLSGEAFVFEFASGAAWGYPAYSSLPPRAITDTLYPADFRYAASRNPADVAFMPLSEVTTAFLVTPVSADQTPDVANNYRARIDIRSTVRGDLFDRDENLISGTSPVDVVCVGRVNLPDLISDGVEARLSNGGWGRVWNYRLVQVGSNWVPANFARANQPSTGGLTPTPANAAAGAFADPRYNADDGAVVIKLEYNLGATLNGEAVGGTYNNAIMLRPDPNNYFLNNYQ